LSIQFYHYRLPKFIPDTHGFSYFQCGVTAKGGQTVAMQPLRSWLVNAIQEGEFFTRLIGRALCSDKDNYNRKTGREIALTRMKQVRLTANKALITHGPKGVERTVHLKDDEGNIYVLKALATDTAGNARFIEFIPSNKKGRK
jgi:hypothetical protein